MEIDDIFGYDKMVAAEHANLQAGMNYRAGKEYSIFLMSTREGAPYADAVDPVTGMLTYEGHDEKRRPGVPDPKTIDQPAHGPKTENFSVMLSILRQESGQNRN
jgi:hypothetical protein